MEALVAGALVLLLLQASWTLLATQGRASGDIVRTAVELDATRLARHVLAVEVLEGSVGEDWSLDAGELRLRAHRGFAVLCALPEGSEALGASVAGLRHPDRDKDSVLVLDDRGVWRVGQIQSRSLDPPGCVDQEPFHQERWILDPPVPGAVFARYFEHGAYGFSSNSFRYQASGRWQPLLPPHVDANASTLTPVGAGGVLATLRWAGQGAPSTWVWSVWSRPEPMGIQ